MLLNKLIRRVWQGTVFAPALCHTIRLKLLEIGARVLFSVRRLFVSLASRYPYQQNLFLDFRLKSGDAVDGAAARDDPQRLSRRV